MYLVVEVPELDVGMSEEVRGIVEVGLVSICVALSLALAVGVAETDVPVTKSLGAGKALTNTPNAPQIANSRQPKPLAIFLYAL